MAIEKNRPVQINVVSNGYTVTPVVQRHEFSSTDNMLVFESFDGMVAWMRNHYDLRSYDVKSDQMVKLTEKGAAALGDAGAAKAAIRAAHAMGQA